MEPNQTNSNPFASNSIPKPEIDLPDLGPKNFNIPATIRGAVSEETLKTISEQNSQPQSPTEVVTDQTTQPPVQSTGFQPSSVANPWQAPTIQPQDSEVFA